jgi:CheY-like chemotaxis protein
MSSGAASTPRLLAVEDNRADLLLVEQGVEQATTQVELQSIRNGSRAIERLTDGSDMTAVAPQLILLDLNLPGQSGFEVLRAVRDSDSFSDVPVAVVSSSENPDDVARAYRLGANAYVTKPQDPDDYIQMVVAAIDFWIPYTHDS